MHFPSTWPIRSWGGGSHALAGRDEFSHDDPKFMMSAGKFARSVRGCRWNALLPLLASLAAGAAMLGVAAVPPPSVVGGRPPAGFDSRSDPTYHDPAADLSNSYQPAPNWAWPSLEKNEPPTSMVTG